MICRCSQARGRRRHRRGQIPRKILHSSRWWKRLPRSIPTRCRPAMRSKRSMHSRRSWRKRTASSFSFRLFPRKRERNLICFSGSSPSQGRADRRAVTSPRLPPQPHRAPAQGPQNTTPDGEPRPRAERLAKIRDRHKGQRQPDQRHLRMRHDACRHLAADPRMQNDDRAAKYDREQCEHSRGERADGVTRGGHEHDHGRGRERAQRNVIARAQEFPWRRRTAVTPAQWNRHCIDDRVKRKRRPWRPADLQQQRHGGEPGDQRHAEAEYKPMALRQHRINGGKDRDRGADRHAADRAGGDEGGRMFDGKDKVSGSGGRGSAAIIAPMNGRERSTTIEMKTTMAAVITILKTSSSQNGSSGGIFVWSAANFTVTLRSEPTGPARSGRPDDKLREPRRATARNTGTVHPSTA